MSEIVHMEKSSRDRLLAVIAELEAEVARLREAIEALAKGMEKGNLHLVAASLRAILDGKDQ